MIIEKSKFKICPTCNHEKIEREETRACDNCAGILKEQRSLSLRIFHLEEDCSTFLEFCSWKCCLEILAKTKTDYFVDLPDLYFEKNTPNKISVKGFWEAVKAFKFNSGVAW